MSSVADRAASVNGPRVVKRSRRTRAEIASLRKRLREILAEDHPQSVRQVFYRATVLGLVPKTEDGYVTIKRLLGEMRRSRAVPYTWIADSPRWMRKPTTWSSLEDPLRNTART